MDQNGFLKHLRKYKTEIGVKNRKIARLEKELAEARKENELKNISGGIQFEDSIEKLHFEHRTSHLKKR